MVSDTNIKYEATGRQFLWYFPLLTKKVRTNKRKLIFYTEIYFFFVSDGSSRQGNFFHKSSTKLVPDVSLLKSLISTKAAELGNYVTSNKSSLVVVSISDFTQLHIWHISANKFSFFYITNNLFMIFLM